MLHPSSALAPALAGGRVQSCCAWLCALLTPPPCSTLDLPHCYWMVVDLGPAQLTLLRYMVALLLPVAQVWVCCSLTLLLRPEGREELLRLWSSPCVGQKCSARPLCCWWGWWAVTGLVFSSLRPGSMVPSSPPAELAGKLSSSSHTSSPSGEAAVRGKSRARGGPATSHCCTQPIHESSSWLCACSRDKQ